MGLCQPQEDGEEAGEHGGGASPPGGIVGGMEVEQRQRAEPETVPTPGACSL